MIQIGDTLISLDIIERAFICDIGRCKGACCIEGDSGAPLEEEEHQLLKTLLPEIWDDLLPDAQELIEKQGIAYIDPDGDLVTSIKNGKDCVFTGYDNDGTCICAIEKAYHEGRINYYKPISCHLYPIRITNYDTFRAVNYNRWGICKVAEELGKKEGVPVYKFLRQPLIRKFGEDWYNELETIAEEWTKQKET